MLLLLLTELGAVAEATEDFELFLTCPYFEKKGKSMRQGKILKGKRVFQISLRSLSRFVRTFPESSSFSQPMTERQMKRTHHMPKPEVNDAKRPPMSPYVPKIQMTRARIVLTKAKRMSCIGRPKYRKFLMAKAAAALLLRGSMWVLQMMVMMVARADCATARTIQPWYL